MIEKSGEALCLGSWWYGPLVGRSQRWADTNDTLAFGDCQDIQSFSREESYIEHI